MPAYNFRSEFAAAVETGEKRQTIRRASGREPGPGDLAYLYTGMRTKACRRLYVGWIRQVYRLHVDPSDNPQYPDPIWYMGPVRICGPDLIRMSRADGFPRPSDMVAFFRSLYGPPPWELRLICWDYLMRTVDPVRSGSAPWHGVVKTITLPAGSLVRVISAPQAADAVVVQRQDGQRTIIRRCHLTPAPAPGARWAHAGAPGFWQVRPWY